MSRLFAFGRFCRLPSDSALAAGVEALAFGRYYSWGLRKVLMDLARGQTVIYPAHGACIVQRVTKIVVDGVPVEYVVLKTVLNEMTVSVPFKSLASVGLRPPVSGDELDDLLAVLSKPDPRVPSNWSRRFKNHQESA